MVKYMEVKVAGFLVKREMEYLEKILSNPQRPLIVILGGAKISDKIKLIENLLPRVDSLVIGGGMAYTFLRCQGVEIGKSLVEDEQLSIGLRILNKAKEEGKRLLLPVDHVVAKEPSPHPPPEIVEKIPEGWMALDIGPKTIDLFSKEIEKAKTIFWNGPLGVFEIEAFNKGTFAILGKIADSKAVSIVGGGDSVRAVKRAGMEDKIDHVSTGGGALIEFLEGRKLPGIEVLEDA